MDEKEEYESYKKVLDEVLDIEIQAGIKIKEKIEELIKDLPIIANSPIYNLMLQRIIILEKINKICNLKIDKAEDLLGIELEKKSKREEEFEIERFPRTAINEKMQEKEKSEKKGRMEVYCRKCGKKTEQINSEIKVNKKNVKYSEGNCSACGRKTFVMLPKIMK